MCKIGNIMLYIDGLKSYLKHVMCILAIELWWKSLHKFWKASLFEDCKGLGDAMTNHNTCLSKLTNKIHAPRKIASYRDNDSIDQWPVF